MRRFWEQLTKSQKQTVTSALVIALAALIVQFAVFPYLDARQRIRGAIIGNEKRLREIAALGAEYGFIRQRSEEVSRIIERRPPGFSLLSFLEKRADEAGVKTNITSINHLKPSPAGIYQEIAAEIKLEKLTMKQLTDFLYLVESRNEAVRVRKMTAGKMKENPEYLSVLIQVFTYQPAQRESR